MAETKEEAIRVALEPNEPKDFNPDFSELQDKAQNLSRTKEQGFVNEQNGSSVSLREDGQINLAASKYSQYKISPSGRTKEVSLESETYAVRKKFNVDEFIINEHKMNPALWELSEFREAHLTTNPKALVGGLMINGSILVKAWEPNLKRHMMIRRPWRGPIFGTLLNVPDINPALNIPDPLKYEEDILAKSSSGYQVNSVISDAASLIGKVGQDRGGIDRTSDAMSGAASMTQSGGGVGSSQGNGKNYLQYKGVATNGSGLDVNAPHPNISGTGAQRWAPYCVDAIVANGLEATEDRVARLIAQIDTESSGNADVGKQKITDVNSGGNEAYGLMQIIPSTWDAHAFQGHNDKDNGYDQLLTAVHYIRGAYGDDFKGIGEGHGY